jgi:uncharacterized protein
VSRSRRAAAPTASPLDLDEVTAALGRRPQAAFDVVVRNRVGRPAVIRNAPLLENGRPMPTRYWLVDPELCAAVGRLEAAGGVREAEREVGATEVRAAHLRYAAERDAEVPPDWAGPRASGGVGGTRRGVKCLHAHLAWWLAGGDDPVGAWAARRLGVERDRPAAGSFLREDPTG